jgi:hypothetical protein
MALNGLNTHWEIAELIVIEGRMYISSPQDGIVG